MAKKYINGISGLIGTDERQKVCCMRKGNVNKCVYLNMQEKNTSKILSITNNLLNALQD